MISIEAFEELDQEKDLKNALERAKAKEQEYLQLIRNLEGNSNTKGIRESQREIELGGIIESIYKLFSEINDHMKKQLDPQAKSTI